MGGKGRGSTDHRCGEEVTGVIRGGKKEPNRETPLRRYQISKTVDREDHVSLARIALCLEVRSSGTWRKRLRVHAATCWGWSCCAEPATLEMKWVVGPAESYSK